MGFAQIQSFDSTYIEGLKKDIWGTYREIVKQNLTLTEDQSKVFWPLFDEFVAAHNPIFENRVKNTEEYMMNYYGLDEETAKDLINKAVKLEQDRLKMKTEYINKMLEKLPATVVGKIFRIDARVSTLVDLVRMSAIPMVRDEE